MQIIQPQIIDPFNLNHKPSKFRIYSLFSFKLWNRKKQTETAIENVKKYRKITNFIGQ